MFARTRRGRARFMTREKPRYLEEIFAAWDLVSTKVGLPACAPVAASSDLFRNPLTDCQSRDRNSGPDDVGLALPP